MRYIICILLLLCLSGVTVSADDTVCDYYSSLPSGIKNLFPEDFEDKLENDGASAVAMLDAKYILSFVSDTIKATVSDSVSDIGALLCIVILSSVMLTFSDGITYKPMLAVSSFAVICCLIDLIKPMLEQVRNQLEGTSDVMKLSLPVMTAISGASGQPSSATVNALWLNTALTLTHQLTQSILSPLISVCITMVIAASIFRFNGNNTLSGTVATVKKTFTFIITLIAAVFTTTMSFQNVIAKGSDTILLRSIKFASGSAIPIIGGALSEAAGAYLSGIALIKSSLGTLCAICIAVSTLPIIIKLFALKIALCFSAFLCDILGGAVGTDIREFTSVLDLLISISVLCSVTFIIAAGAFSAALPS